VPSNDPLLTGLGSAIRALRFERGDISQERLGLETGVHRNYIGGIERGERKPTVQTIATLALALGLAPSRLLARAEREAERHGASWPNGEGPDRASARRPARR
jgi:transcriptional regulator with XRE-family HTH domain